MSKEDSMHPLFVQMYLRFMLLLTNELEAMAIHMEDIQAMGGYDRDDHHEFFAQVEVYEPAPDSLANLAAQVPALPAEEESILRKLMHTEEDLFWMKSAEAIFPYSHLN